jgi:hypothetical protein
MFQFIFNKENYAKAKPILMTMKIAELGMEDSSVKAISVETDPTVFGVHWFNGAADAKKYCNHLDLQEIKNRSARCLIDELVQKYA